MKNIRQFILGCMMSVVLSVTTVSATCWHDGVEYPTGAVIGSYVCSENGTWVKK